MIVVSDTSAISNLLAIGLEVIERLDVSTA